MDLNYSKGSKGLKMNLNGPKITEVWNSESDKILFDKIEP